MEGVTSIEKKFLDEINRTPLWIPARILLPHRKYLIVRIFEKNTQFGDRVIVVLQDGTSLVRTSLPARFMNSVTNKKMRIINHEEFFFYYFGS